MLSAMYSIRPFHTSPNLQQYQVIVACWCKREGNLLPEGSVLLLEKLDLFCT